MKKIKMLEFYSLRTSEKGKFPKNTKNTFSFITEDDTESLHEVISECIESGDIVKIEEYLSRDDTESRQAFRWFVWRNVDRFERHSTISIEKIDYESRLMWLNGECYDISEDWIFEYFLFYKPEIVPLPNDETKVKIRMKNFWYIIDKPSRPEGKHVNDILELSRKDLYVLSSSSSIRSITSSMLDYLVNVHRTPESIYEELDVIVNAVNMIKERIVEL